MQNFPHGSDDGPVGEFFLSPLYLLTKQEWLYSSVNTHDIYVNGELRRAGMRTCMQSAGGPRIRHHRIRSKARDLLLLLPTL